MKLAFYKGKGDLKDAVIRWATASEYSHVELVGHDGKGYSSSHRDGGVRAKDIEFTSENWDFIDIPWVDQKAIDRIVAEAGKKYDYKGIVLSQMLNLRRHAKKRWFCSEIVAMALGLPQPQTISPGDLYQRAKFLQQYEPSGYEKGKPWTPVTRYSLKG